MGSFQFFEGLFRHHQSTANVMGIFVHVVFYTQKTRRMFYSTVT